MGGWRSCGGWFRWGMRSWGLIWPRSIRGTEPGFGSGGRVLPRLRVARGRAGSARHAAPAFLAPKAGILIAPCRVCRRRAVAFCLAGGGARCVRSASATALRRCRQEGPGFHRRCARAGWDIAEFSLALDWRGPATGPSGKAGGHAWPCPEAEETVIDPGGCGVLSGLAGAGVAAVDGVIARSAQSSQSRGLVRRSTATSCRSTSSSASLEADDRPSRTSQPQSRTKMR